MPVVSVCLSFIAMAETTYAVADRIATVTLNRPEARNGYTIRMADELGAAMDRADRDEDVRVVVLTGAGNDFCVGADLSQGGFDFDPATGPDAAWQEPMRPLLEADLHDEQAGDRGAAGRGRRRR